MPIKFSDMIKYINDDGGGVMAFKRGDLCYILENNSYITRCKVVNKSGNLYTLQPVGSCGAFRLPGHRLFDTEEDALNSMITPLNMKDQEEKKSVNTIPDVFEGRRTNKSPHTYDTIRKRR